MKKILFLLVLLIMYAIQLNATIRTVPGDYGSIQAAIEASVNKDTVLVEPNTYFENIDFKGKNIVLGSLFLTTNDTSIISQTIINGSASGSVVTIKNNEDSTAMLIGFTIRNGKTEYGGGIRIQSASPTISNCIIRNNTVEATNPLGAGIYMTNSHSTIYSCEIMYNSANGINTSNGWGGGIASTHSSDTVTIVNCKIHHNQVTSIYGGIGLANTKAKIIGCEITNNFCYSSGSGIGCQDSELQLINSTIANNKAVSRNDALFFIRSSPVIQNCVIWYNLDNNGYSNIYGWGGTPEIFFSNIQGGYDTLSVMDLEPMFADTAAGDFRLKENSPCIDAGDPDTSGLHLPIHDLFGNLRLQDGNGDGISIVDIGAHEFAAPSVNVEHKIVTDHPNAYQLKQNYPNPFNSSTRISYYLPMTTEVTLTISNLLGKKIVTLVDSKQSKGNHSVIWTGTNNLNHKVTSGVYLCQLRAGDNIFNNKMILLE
ncbi:MAG: T9SS type A sorting domain-containing protein [Ignavibacteriales bacterium]|nr:T9SS type A sorting domain-containing protein [Ignavibacteriales bacterium]